MRILLTVATKNGSTGEIGQFIAAELRERGHEVLEASPDAATVQDVDAVIVGSAIYMSRWMPEARIFAEQNAEILAAMPVWVFSSGLAALRTGREIPAEPALLELLEPRGRAHFHGRLDLERLTLRERSVVRLTRAPEGDFRDWSAVRSWAAEIDAALVPSS